MPRSLMIGDLARMTDTKVNTIRYYEGEGLLPRASRTTSGRRTYELADVARLSFIRRARALGFSLGQVRTLLSISDERDRPCAEVDVLARQHLAQVKAKIADLKKLQGELSNMIDCCAHGTMSECRILEALAPDWGR